MKIVKAWRRQEMKPKISWAGWRISFISALKGPIPVSNEGLEIMFDLRRLYNGDELGVSSVLGAILVLGIVIGIGSLMYAMYIQSTTKSTESNFMEEAGSAFIKLQSAVAAGDNVGVSISMSPSFPPLITTKGEVATISLDPGVAYPLQKVGAMVWGSGNISGSLDGLAKLGDGNYLEANQVIWMENFPFPNLPIDWDMRSWATDPGLFYDCPTTTDSPGYDGSITHDEDTGSIHVSFLASSNTPATGPGSAENALWERTLDNILDNYDNDNITVQAWFSKLFNYTGSAANYNAYVNPPPAPGPNPPPTNNTATKWQVVTGNLVKFIVENSPSDIGNGNKNQWKNPENAFTSDNTYAYSNSDGKIEWYKNYGFNSFPPLAMISTVEVGYEAYASVNDGFTIAVSWDGGKHLSKEIATGSLPTSDPNSVRWVDVTRATTWTWNKLSDDNFLVQVKEKHIGPQDTVYLDWIPVRVTYYVLENTYSMITYENDNAASVDWTENTSSPLRGENLKALAAYMWVKENKTKGSDYAYLNAYMDDISLLDGPPFLDNLIIQSGSIINTQDVDSIDVTLTFFENDNPSEVNLYILENNGTSNWLINPNLVLEANSPLGQVSPGGKITFQFPLSGDNLDNCINENGIITLNLVARNGDNSFRLLLDYLNFQVNYVNTTNINYQGYYGDSGKFMFAMNNYYFPKQTYVYDDGAVIVAQNNSSAMVSDPSNFLDVENADGNNIIVRVNHFVLKGVGASISRSGWTSVVATVSSTYPIVTPCSGQPENETVEIAIEGSPLTSEAWASYLSDRADYLNSVGFFTDKGFTATADGPTLTISRNDNDDVNEIYYYETVTDVQLSLSS